MANPKIGVPRVYNTAICPKIYPGEVAEASIDLVKLLQIIQENPGITNIEPPINGWIVEPAPGLYAKYLRIRYRVFGQFFKGGKPALEVDLILKERTRMKAR